MHYRWLTSNFSQRGIRELCSRSNFDLSSAKLDGALSSLWQWQIDGEWDGVVNLWCKRRFSLCFPVSWFDNKYCHSVWPCFDQKISVSVSSLTAISWLEYTCAICGLMKSTWKWIKSFKLLPNSFGIEFSSKYYVIIDFSW